jgi:UDP-3-O-[3-hydroxymyristoyl] glucosamine N-acyltransferase
MSTVAELALKVHGEVVGDPSVQISGLGRIDFAKEGELTFLADPKYSKFLPLSQASAVIVTKGMNVELDPARTYILVDEAYRAFVILMREFYPPLQMKPGTRHASAVVSEQASVAATAAIGPGCIISKGCVIGDGVQLAANVVLYPDVTVSDDTMIHANVTVYQGVRIGKRGIVHAGAVIGSDGFGFIENKDGSFVKIPQVGTVVIGDDVEIGANVTIDRAAVGATQIGSGVKVDNLVHIAHGVVLGEHTAIAAQAGVSGSTKVGKRNRLAGQVGVVGHITLGDDVIVEAQSGVSKSLAGPGVYFGSPAKEHMMALKMEAALRQLPGLLHEIRELKQTVEELKKHGA